MSKTVIRQRCRVCVTLQWKFAVKHTHNDSVGQNSSSEREKKKKPDCRKIRIAQA